MLLENKVAVITGGASGIGRQTAVQFAEHGASVVVADVDEDGGTEIVEAIRDGGGDATFVRADTSDPDDVKGMIETAVSEYGGLDVLCNNAGIEGPWVELVETDLEAFERVVSVNLTGVFLGLKYGIEAMLADGGGSIINTSSVGAASGLPGRCAYAATKAGVNGMTRVAAIEYAEDDIRVNSVLPGIVKTPMIRRTNRVDPSARIDRFDLGEAMSGIGEPSDLANAMVFLGSDLSARITGVELPVDGGFLAQP